MDRIATVAALLALTRAATHGHTGSGAAAPTLNVGPWPTAMVLDRKTGHAFVLNSGNNTVSVLDTRRGTLLRTTAVGTFPGAFVQTGYTRAMAVDERSERVFVGGYGRPGGITTLDAVSGRALSSSALPLAPRQIAVDEVTNRLFVSSHGVATTMLVSVLDATSGRLLHTVTLDQGVGPLAVDERGGRVLAAGDRGVSVLDAHSGAVVRTIPGGPGPIVVNGRSGRLFVASTPGRSAGPAGAIDVVDLKDGGVLRTIEGLYPQYLTIAEGLNRVYATGPGPAPTPILTGPGSVSVLDAATGTLLRTVVVGCAPLVLAVDAIAGHAIILNANAVGPRPGNGSVSIVAMTP